MASSSKCQEWQDYRPSVRSQVVKLQTASASALLSTVCISLEHSESDGSTCKTRPLGSQFADMTDGTFQAQGVVFGHFLGAETEDAAISGSSNESHPDHGGGTLLLTLRNKTWVPIWYKSGLITRSCEKGLRPDGREILICEFEDGGMGHRYHSLFGVDLRSVDLRSHSWQPPAFAQADSFQSDFCTAQRQSLESVTWDSSRRSFSVVIRTPEWHRLPDGYCGSHPPVRPPLALRLEFDITDEGIRPRAPRRI